jgi:amidase
VVPATGYLDHESGGTTEADVNVLGPITRSAEDLELLLGLLLRNDGPLVATLRPAPADARALRVAAWLDDPFCPVDRKVVDVMAAAVNRLEAAGVTVDRTARPDLDPDQAADTGMWLVTAAMAQSMPAEELDGAEVDTGLGEATHRQWLAMHAQREALRARWAAFFEDFDAVIMPVCFVPPFAHDQAGTFGTRTLTCNGEHRPYADLVRWTILTGMAYLPATVPPLGLDSDGLPIGCQVVGPYGGDRITLSLAGLMAELSGGYRTPTLA